MKFEFYKPEKTVTGPAYSGMFKVLAAGAGKSNPVADAISTGVKPVGDQATAMQDAWQKANADMNAWRNQGGAN